MVTTMVSAVPIKSFPVRLTGLPKARIVMAALGLALVSVSAARAEDDYAYRITQGDTLIALTNRLLNTPADWPKVARYNRLPNANFIVPGNTLRIPFSLLKTTPATATVTHVEGDVKVAPAAAGSAASVALGATLAEGAQVVTGKNGYVTLKLQDGSTVRVQSATQMEVERMRTYAGVGLFESAMKLLSGRVESLVQKFKPGETVQTRNKVNTPLATLAVRGTEFRVTMDPRGNQTRGEVLEGVVAVTGDAAGAAGKDEKRLQAGFGSVVDATKTVSDPVVLLAAPDVSRLPKIQERPLLRFALPAQAGARAYRAQLARDAGFNSVVAELVSASPEVRVANIDDGSYFLRVRAIDTRGLEGRDATHAFNLKARPEPPLVSTPAPKSKVRAAEVEFKWSENTEAAIYHLQVAKDATFKSLIFENKSIKGPVAVTKLPLGDYFWRIASLRKDGDRGPYGDVASFALLPPPAQPEPPQIGEGDIKFRWAGEPGQKFEFQLASDTKFAQVLATRSLDKPEIDLPRPKPGTYFMRYRATDPDGFVGPFTSAQTFSVPVPPPCLMDSAGRCVTSTHGIVGPSQ